MVRMGRPPLDHAMRERMSFRFDEDSKRILDAYCKRFGIDRGEAMRRAIKKLEEELPNDQLEGDQHENDSGH